MADHHRVNPHNGGAIMPYGESDWLALTQEPTLEREIPICDPHHHFWDLRPERVPYQRYLLHELVADVNCGHNVRSTVFIETRAMYPMDRWRCVRLARSSLSKGWPRPAPAAC